MDRKWICVLISALWVQLGGALDTLTSPLVTDWGIWGDFEYCPDGTRVIGFQLKTEPWDSWNAVVDDTCLNGIRFYCGYSETDGPGDVVYNITSSVGNWGQWGRLFWCDGHGYAVGFTLRSEEAKTTLVDETAANNLRILCKKGERWIEGDGETWGEWTSPRVCKERQYICGLQTQVEPQQGVLGDDTALNNIRVACCNEDETYYPYPIESSTSKPLKV